MGTASSQLIENRNTYIKKWLILKVIACKASRVEYRFSRKGKYGYKCRLASVSLNPFIVL